LKSQTKQLIQKEQANLIFTNTQVPFTAAKAAYSLQLPHVWWIHEFGEEDFGFRIGWGKPQEAYRKMEKWSRLVICNSDAVVKKFKGLMPAATVKRVYQPVSFSAKPVVAEKKVARFLMFGQITASKAHREVIEYIVEKSIVEGYELSAVTNGYDFIEYIDLLKRAKIKEIQFTLDGTQAVHDLRRMTANHKGTFDRVIAGMEQAIAHGMPVNLRTVTDKQNIGDLVGLAELLDQKGWLDLPPELFKTQIGRNYELFECYEKPEHLFSQVEMWGYIAKLAEKYPVMRKFHRPDFMGIRYLVETGEMYLASFDTCPAGKTEWVFDLYGDIYGCTASCGREDFRLGTYWPEVEKNETAIQSWKNRNVTTTEECKSCKYNVGCVGD